MFRSPMAAILFIVGLMLAGPASAATAHDFGFTSIDGKPLPLSSFKGKVLLVVNTASLDSYTPQYQALQALWRKYKGKGLVVLGVPSNDFGDLEPGTNKQIKQFTVTNYAVDFPLTEKAVVKGSAAHPFYQWVASEKGEPRWNFHKYLVDRNGRLVGAFTSLVEPGSDELIEVIDRTLGR